jgi:hypothetical protein
VAYGRTMNIVSFMFPFFLLFLYLHPMLYVGLKLKYIFENSSGWECLLEHLHYYFLRSFLLVEQ